MAFSLQVCDEVSEDERDAIADGVLSHGRAQAHDGGALPLACLVHDDGQLVAGGLARTEYDRLFVNHLWVAEPFRRRGLGSRILRELEAEAARRGCRDAIIETLDEAAARLYRRLGYAPIAVIAGYVGRFNRHMMLKPDIREP